MSTTPAPRPLDPAQRRIVALAASASGVVIGGPGTGKTEVLVARAEALVSELSSDAVLVLTPTRQTATRLRDRLTIGVGVATEGPLARSVASFAYQLVRATAVHEPPRLLTGGMQDRLIADLLEEDEADELEGRARWPREIGPAVRRARAFRTELRTVLAECAELGVGPSELARCGQAAGVPAWQAAASFLADYLDVRDAMGGAERDAAELLVEAVTLLGDPERALADLGPAAGLRAVLVDDVQELTRGGVRLLEALRSRGVAVLAFGDPDISSGAFRGATPDRFAEVCALLGAVHVLDAPHRQTPELTHLVRTTTSAIGVAGRVEHRRPPETVDDPDPTAVRVWHAASPHEETDAIARMLREARILEDVPWGSMAVIAHDARQVADLAAELAAREVPARAGGVMRPLGEESAVRDLLMLVRVGLTAPGDRDPDDLAAVLVSPFGGLDAVGLRRLRARLRHAELAEAGTRSARELVASALARPLELVLLDTPEARIAERVASTLAAIHTLGAEGGTLHELLWVAWDAARDGSGRRIADVWYELATGGGVLSAEVERALDAVVALFDVARRDGERGEATRPSKFIERILGSDVADDTLSAPDRPATVAVLTPAGALGTEFDLVVVAGVQDGVWPNVRLRGGALEAWRLGDEIVAGREGRSLAAAERIDRRRAVLHDELRLFVRALSRARRRVVVTAVDDDDHGPSPFFRLLPAPDAPPSDTDAASGHPLTLRGLVARHRRVIVAGSQSERRHAAGQLVALARAGVTGADPAEWFGVAAPSSDAPLRDPDRAPVPVSPSRIETFATCPLDWAIRALGGETRTWSAGVGTILHAALEEVPTGELERLQEVVDSRWGELTFEAPWMSAKEHAWAETLVRRLHAYLATFHEHGGRTMGAEAEFRIAVGLDDDAAPAVRADGDVSGRVAVVAGTVDRIEVFPPGRGEGLPLVDGASARERAVIVDLKTGRSEHRVTDDKVADDAQLAAYQLALVEGRLGFDPSDVDHAGARLLVLSKTLKGGDYRMARQPPMDGARRAAFLERIVATARAMAADRFTAHIDAHCRSDRFAVCPIHTVKAVSAP